MRDLHMHSVFSDGRDTPEEMVRAALEMGLETVGLSDHSHVSFEDPSVMPLDRRAEYRAEMNRLKKKYAGRIEVLCGLERDYYCDDPDEYDYTIGSVHDIRMPDGHFVCVDGSPEQLTEEVRQYFGGDWYALTEAYYQLEGRVAEVTRCDIIGHFDLVTKFNEKHRFFDENHPRYVNAWQAAAKRLLASGKPFEVNTGAISRGYRSVPYPSAAIQAFLLERGAELIPASDAHRREHICYAFDRFFPKLT